eukprot:TRINITY_DN37252_c0_g1_i1.p1 TRINITY_DN37252_c0_g1~~TRINITY_DN37252_c0_g1_i1.p1  ORF type:complete len:505 (+),score=113.98 TRINITY_DN37252_c0_g1_i1:96-1610(+)
MMNSGGSLPATGVRSLRVAVFNMEIAGTVNPLLPVIGELVSKGCEVHYYLSKPGLMKEVEKASGAKATFFDDLFGRWGELLEEDADWLQANGFSAEVAAELKSELSQGEIPQKMLYYSLPSGICLARRLTKLWSSGDEDWCPELVLYNVMLLYPFLAASKLSIPAASFSTYPGPGVAMHLYCIPEDEREAWDAALALHRGVALANGIAKSEFGVDVTGTQLACRHFSNDLNLIFSIPALGSLVQEYQQKLLDDSTFLWVGDTGSVKHRLSDGSAAAGEKLGSQSLGGNKDEAPWVTPSGTKVLLVSLGTLTVDMRWDATEHRSSKGLITGRAFCERLWRELLSKFGNRSNLRVIIAVGPRAEAQKYLETIPSNFVALPYFDQIQALGHADAFITHGGANSVKEAVLAGVPMIVTPFCVDQPQNGAAVERAKAGVCFPDLMATPEGEIAAAVEAAIWGSSGQEQRVQCKELAAALERAGGAEAAAGACLALMARRNVMQAATAGA